MADWDEFDAEIATAPVSGVASDRLQQTASMLRDPELQLIGLDVFREALGSRESADALEAALLQVAAAIPRVYIALRDQVLPTVYRTLPPA